MKKSLILLMALLLVGVVFGLSTSNFGNVLAQGNVTLNGTYVNVTGLLYGVGNVDFNQNLSVGGDLDVVDDVSVGDDLAVSGSVSVSENITVGNSSNVVWDNNGKIYVNGTCVKIDSPSGTGTLTVCD